MRWVDGENWLAVQLPTSDQKARIRRRLGGDATSVLATSATTLSLTSGTWYTAKVLVDDDLGNSALQRLRFWVDTDGDGDFSDETTLLDSTAVDNDWSAGMVGLQRGAGGSATHQWDDFKVGYDNNADGDIDDAPDDTLADDNFNTNSVTLTYDSNGNLTGDGVWTYTYDAWDRIIEAKVGEAFGYGVRWYPDGRLARRITVWTEIHLGDHGATTYERSLTEYYLHTWGGIAEIIDGGGRTLQQLCWDVPAQRRLVFYDVNGELTENDCDPDVTASGEVASADKRYFVSYDDEGRATALTGYTSGGGGDNGKIIERYAYLPDGRGVALSGDGGAGETGALRPASQYGLTLAPFDTRDHDNPGGPRYCAAWVCLPDAPDVSGAPPRPPTCDPGQVAVGGRCVPEVVSPPPPIGPPVGPCGPGYVQWGADGCLPEWVNPWSLPPQSKPTTQSQPSSQPASGPAPRWCTGFDSFKSAVESGTTPRITGLRDWLNSNCENGAPTYYCDESECAKRRKKETFGETSADGKRILLCGPFDKPDYAFVMRQLLYHELIHAWQICTTGGGDTDNIDTIACREYQAYSCAGQCGDMQTCVRKCVDSTVERCLRTKTLCGYKDEKSLRLGATAACRGASENPACNGNCESIPGYK